MTGGGKRPKTPRTLETGVGEYLTSCQEEERIPTVTGLALFLGFVSRGEMETFTTQRSPVYQRQMERALSLIEEETLQAAFRRETTTGARFLLQASFGYGDKASKELGPITVHLEGEE
ncbi:MAG: terminase small subunit [Acutalibacter sp.]|jgi:hypothetical protein